MDLPCTGWIRTETVDSSPLPAGRTRLTQGDRRSGLTTAKGCETQDGPRRIAPAAAHARFGGGFSFLVAVAMFILAVGCATKSPVAIEHVVLISLTNHSERDALETDCLKFLAHIPGVEALSVGAPIDTGRPTVDADYDTGIIVSFASKEAYAAYVTHPDHLALGTAWKSRIAKMRIFDFGP